MASFFWDFIMQMQIIKNSITQTHMANSTYRHNSTKLFGTGDTICWQEPYIYAPSCS